MVKKKNILDAAYKLFAQKGYFLSMSELAGVVGLKVPSLYSHFEGKEDIIYSMLERETEVFYKKLFAAMDDILEEKTGLEERLKEIGSWFIQYFDDEVRIRCWKNISLIHPKDLREKCKMLVVRGDLVFIERIKLILEEAKTKEDYKITDLETTVAFYWIMIQGALDEILVFSETKQSWTENFDMLWTAFLDSFRPQKISDQGV